MDAILQECAAKIVASYLSRHQVDTAEIPQLITSVCTAFRNAMGQQPDAELPPEPVVSIRRSIRPDSLICLCCGFEGKMLKRHLRTAHDMTPDDYRRYWNLPSDYPVVCPNYAQERSTLAKQIGLGLIHRSKDEPEPEPEPEPIPPIPPSRSRSGLRKAKQVTR